MEQLMGACAQCIKLKGECPNPNMAKTCKASTEYKWQPEPTSPEMSERGSFGAISVCMSGSI